MAEIQCTRCEQSAPQLNRAPLPGDVGQQLLASTCTACWKEWMAAQVIVINENSFSPANPEHYQKLLVEMKAFLKLGGEG